MGNYECEMCGQCMTEDEHKFCDMCPDCLDALQADIAIHGIGV